MSSLKDQYIADLERLVSLCAELDRLKSLYAEYDEIVMRLQAQGFTEADHEGRHFLLQDNFKGANTAYRVSFAKRFDIKVTEAKK